MAAPGERRRVRASPSHTVRSQRMIDSGAVLARTATHDARVSIKAVHEAASGLCSVATALPLRGAIVGFWGGFCGVCKSHSRREVAGFRDFVGGPNGIRTRVSALRGPCPGPLDDGAAREEWLGEEDSNPRYRGQNPASYR